MMVISIFTLPEEGKSWAECKTGDICDCLTYEYEKLFNGAGTFTIEIPITSRFRDRVLVNSVLVTDSGDALIVKNIQTTLDKVKITGYDLNGLLHDRVTMYSGNDPDNDGTDECEGSTEYCVKHYVGYNLAACDRDANRNLARFGVAENLDRGDPEDSNLPRLQNVHDVVTEMCEAAKIGWRVSVNGNAAASEPIFVFDVAEQVDRSVNQSDRNRVIFSVQQHNVGEMTREVGITAAKNALYLDIDGKVVGYPQADYDSGRTVAVGYDRREEYCSLTGKSLDPDDYSVEAEHNMADRMTETDSLTIEAGNPQDYGRLYDVGTIVTVYDRERSLQLDSVISAATVRMSGTEYTVKLTLGDSKPKLLDQYQKKNVSTTKTVKSEIPVIAKRYISCAVTNSQALTYDSIERGLLSVDFTVEGTDSDVVFAGNQLCDVGTAGTLNCVYKVDGATQIFKPEQSLTAGKHVLPHFYAMTLGKGKHNFALYVLSTDGGKGVTGIGGIIGALSGQISGLKNNAPPNENLILYFTNVSENTEITLPKYMYYDSGAKKYVDWGDGSLVEDSTAIDEVSHTYTAAGDYTVTIKSAAVNFGNESHRPAFSDIFNECITRIYFPDRANEIMWGSSAENFPNLETLVFGKSATRIKWYFTNSTKLTSLIIPETSTYILFMDFKKAAVASVVVPINVTSLNNNGIIAFCECSYLTNLEIYGNITQNSMSAYGCSNLKRLVVGGNATAVGSFRECSSLEDVTLGNKITTIGDSAFYNCSSLKSIKLPASLTEIETSSSYGAFSGSGLTSITLPDKVTVVGAKTFRNCANLTAVHLGASVSSIGERAFYGCTSLSDINFPKSLTSIATYAFSGANLQTVTVNGSIDIGTYAFSNCAALSSVDMGDKKSIPTGCFKDCTNLSSVNFAPDTVVGSYAFSGCGFTTLSLGSINVTTTTTEHGGIYSIGTFAFSKCANLESVDGLKYKWNVGLKTRTSYIDENGNKKWNDWVDHGQVESGIYDAMGATTDSVFSNTKLYEVADYLTNNQLVNTGDIQYSVYHFTG